VYFVMFRDHHEYPKTRKLLSQALIFIAACKNVDRDRLVVFRERLDTFDVRCSISLSSNKLAKT
jgi:hypothetical protein